MVCVNPRMREYHHSDTIATERESKTQIETLKHNKTGSITKLL